MRLTSDGFEFKSRGATARAVSSPLRVGTIAQMGSQKPVIAVVAEVHEQDRPATPDGYSYGMALFRDWTQRTADGLGYGDWRMAPSDDPFAACLAGESPMSEWRSTLGAPDPRMPGFARALAAIEGAGLVASCWDEPNDVVLDVEAYIALGYPPRPCGPVRWCARCGIWTGAWPANEQQQQGPKVIAPCGRADVLAALVKLEAEDGLRRLLREPPDDDAVPGWRRVPPCPAGWRHEVVTTDELWCGGTQVAAVRTIR